MPREGAATTVPWCNRSADGYPAASVAESGAFELLPRDPGLEVHLVLADAPVPRHEVEAELRQVARLDLADVARHKVVVEEIHQPPDCAGSEDSAKNVTLGT